MRVETGERWTVRNQDCREGLSDFPGVFDACVCDPPYELGFMGKAWDKAGVSFDPATWAAVLASLKPGAHMLAFGGTRTYHRITCAIEDAGFEIRDQLAWLYGTGFPKSLNVGDGMGTALKPAQEPICLARKPLVGTVAANVLAHGTGGINIDACRIAGPPSGLTPYVRSTTPPGYELGMAKAGKPVTFEDHALGRWPANVLLDEAAAAMLDEQSGTSKDGVAVKSNTPVGKITGHIFQFGNTGRDQTYGGSGGASRFFYVAKADASEREEGLTGPRRSGGELTDREDGTDGLKSPRAGAGRNGGRRNFHPTVKPIDLMRYLVRLITPPGGAVLDPFMGTGTTGIACYHEGRGFFGFEVDTEHGYFDLAVGRLRASTAQRMLFPEVAG